jgi:hypothetical protein
MMAVAIDDTVGLGKNGPNPFFNGVSGTPGSMAQPDAVSANGDQLADWQELLAPHITHIAMDRMDLFADEGVEDGDISEISGVEDDGTFRKDRVNLFAEGICTAVQMAI